MIAYKTRATSTNVTIENAMLSIPHTPSSQQNQASAPSQSPQNTSPNDQPAAPKRPAPSLPDHPVPPDQLPNHTAPTGATDATGSGVRHASQVEDSGQVVTVVKAGVMALACRGVADQAGAADAVLCDDGTHCAGASHDLDA